MMRGILQAYPGGWVFMVLSSFSVTGGWVFMILSPSPASAVWLLLDQAPSSPWQPGYSRPLF
ncbi:MAG: hypothetical protein KA780_02240 [Prolixibacteraceae bacterium]|nr:hypothetical protein [Prolixibacteraceae bacterium]